MAQKHTVIDITNNAELLRIVEEVTASREPVILQASGGQAAKIVPLRSPTKRTRREMTQADYDDFFSAAGTWADVDTEKLKADLKAARGSRRPPVEL